MIREIRLEDVNTLADINNKLWQSFNILRGDLSVDDYFVLLYFLTIFNEKGDIKVIINMKDEPKFGTPKYDLSCVYIEPESERLKQVNSFFEYFKPIIQKLSLRSVSEIQDIFKSFDHAFITEYFSEIFEFILFEILKLKGKIAGDFSQPLELTKFISRIAGITENARVYNPFAGYASFGIFLPDRSLYLGQEINYSTWVIASLRLLAHHKEIHSYFVNENSIEKWGMNLMPPVDQNNEIDSNFFKYDLIFANPPLGMRLAQSIEGRFGIIKTAEHFLIEKGIDELKNDGKLIAIISQGFLFRGGSEQKLRQFLVENDLIETIVSISGGVLLQTMIPFAVIVLNKRKENKGAIRFVNGNDFVKGSGKSKILADEELLEIIKEQDFDYVRSIPNEVVISNEFNLSVPRYFNNIFEGVELKDLITLIRSSRNNELTFGEIVKVKDLKNDKFNYTYQTGSNTKKEIPSNELVISESCLLIASVGEKIKPTYFNYTGEPIFVSQNILAFHVDDEKVDIDYLINELYADNTIEQLRTVMIGSAMPRLKKEDFLSVKIEMLDLKEQKAKIRGLREEHIKNRERELLLEKQILGLKDDAFREFASIKHTFRQYLNALKSNVSGTRKFITKNVDKSITIDSIYSSNLNRTLGEHLLSLEGTIDSMSNLLTTSDEFPLSTLPTDEDLIKLIEEAQNRFHNAEIFQFEKLYIDRESFTQFDGEMIAPWVSIFKEDFYRVFSNIVSNAVDHGFRNTSSNNLIRTTLSFDAENLYCVLEISNNGKPMSEGFTKQHLITRGEKTSDSVGSGVGGADIKGILEKYNGTMDIKNDKNAEFTVAYIIGLPLIVYSF